MKRFISVMSHHKRRILFVLGVAVVGAFFRWEVKEVVDAQTGRLVAQHRGIALPWQACGPGMAFGKTRINFHVRHWIAYGLIQVEARGQTFAKVDDAK